VPLLTNLRRKMSNKRDRRRKGVIYPGQSGTGRSQNTFFTETGKEPRPQSRLMMTKCGSITGSGAVCRREMGAEHRLDSSFKFSGGVFQLRAPLLGEKWARNTAWNLIFEFQAVFFASGRRFSARNGRETPPGT